MVKTCKWEYLWSSLFSDSEKEARKYGGFSASRILHHSWNHWWRRVNRHAWLKGCGLAKDCRKREIYSVFTLNFEISYEFCSLFHSRPMFVTDFKKFALLGKVNTMWFSNVTWDLEFPGTSLHTSTMQVASFEKQRVVDKNLNFGVIQIRVLSVASFPSV